MLAKLRRAAEEKDEGFTLIELLVVIIIIGILAAIAIPVFLNQRKKATEASMKSDLRTVATQMETYYADNQTYPSVADSSGSVTIGTTTVKLSNGNFAATTTDSSFVSSGGFCIGVYNNSAGGTAGAVYYNSLKGGIQPKGSGCG